MLSIRANQITAKEKLMFKQIFNSLAGNKDGTVTCEQAKSAVRIVVPYTPSQVLARLDSDYGRSVDWPQFEQFMTRVYLELQPMDEIRRAFESMDTDKTGAITALQLKNAIESLGDHADISEAEAMIQEAASTYTDRITLNELITFLMSDDD